MAPTNSSSSCWPICDTSAMRTHCRSQSWNSKPQSTIRPSANSPGQQDLRVALNHGRHCLLPTTGTRHHGDTRLPVCSHAISTQRSLVSQARGRACQLAARRLDSRAERHLDALVYPASSLPPGKTSASAPPPINGRGNTPVWTFMGSQGFPAARIRCPASGYKGRCSIGWLPGRRKIRYRARHSADKCCLLNSTRRKLDKRP